MIHDTQFSRIVSALLCTLEWKRNLLVSEAELCDVDEAEAVAHAHADARHEPPGVDEPDVVGDDDEAEADHVRHRVDVQGALAPAHRVGEEGGGQGAEGQPQLGEAGHPAGLSKVVENIWLTEHTRGFQAKSRIMP